ncbi:MAG: S8 family serine peptidase [Mariniblastus sp.]
MSRQSKIAEQRRLQFEQFEQRLVMSAQAVASILPELDIASPLITEQSVELMPQSELALGDASTTAAGIAAEYGFDGSGQTVAVIDSGIAWDHYALGGGFGEGNKVVGGWDFAENDADPYDDGPAGFHGSHVAGIIGSTDSQYRGVSSGVDLVGLRVFGDSGESDLAWVEQALQWVHEHKDSFEHPITTVNLSLGTNWNAETLPEWATLEDEFAQLEADGLFISVAAGNAFKTFGGPGLSYPAVSEHVVPVASHDDNGEISDFSQRDSNVLVAPGELLRSTVPDHLFNYKSGQFLGSTGTSMSAPYVAGASAVLRQANEFMGETNITQEMLYQQFRDSADQIYDSVTGNYYHRINLEAALASVVQDRHSGSVETATDAGVLSGGETIEGTIGKISDVDTFEFIAERTGQMTLEFEVTHDLVPLIDIGGANADITNNQIKFDVVAGQKYNFAMATAEGNGHYKINVEFEGQGSQGQNQGTRSDGTSASKTNWGQVVSNKYLNQKIDGSGTFEMIAARDGFLTVQSSTDAGEALKLEIYDSNMNRLQTASSQSGDLRLNVYAQKGETYFVKAIGNAESVDFQVNNQVVFESGKLTVHGTNQNDSIFVSTVNKTGNYFVTINDIGYQFDSNNVNDFRVIGHNGIDSINVNLGASDDRVSTRDTGLSVANDSYKLNAFGVQNVSVNGGGGHDTIVMADSAGNDLLTSSVRHGSLWTMLSGEEFQSNAAGFEVVFVGSTGNDRAELQGTAGDDFFVSRPDRNMLVTDATTIMFDGFENVAVDGGGGSDRANLNGSAGADRFAVSPTRGSLVNSAYRVDVSGFETINAIATGSDDSIQMTDSLGQDKFNYQAEVGSLTGNGYSNFAHGFANVEAISVGGFDTAKIVDTAGNDTFKSQGGDVEMTGSGQSVSATGFKVVNLVANQGGFDRAEIKGTDGTDVARAGVDNTRVLMSNGQAVNVEGVESSELDLLEGLDIAFLTGSDGRETLMASYNDIEFETTLQMLRMTNVETSNFDGNGGNDEVEFGELDLLESIGDKATAYLKDQSVIAENFALLEARSVENAIAEYDLEAVDYLYMLRGKWAKK